LAFAQGDFREIVGELFEHGNALRFDPNVYKSVRGGRGGIIHGESLRKNIWGQAPEAGAGNPADGRASGRVPEGAGGKFEIL
jgi:hypothetical protein